MNIIRIEGCLHEYSSDYSASIWCLGQVNWRGTSILGECVQICDNGLFPRGGFQELLDGSKPFISTENECFLSPSY